LINSLSITNFQSHKNTNLEFDENINIIIGQSDSGKSAILRALRWVAENKPSGEAFRSTWGGDTKIKLALSEEEVVYRSKTKTTNQYNIKNAIFTSFGQDIPEEIKRLLNFSPLNFQWQFDSPFLLAMSGGEIARYLNKIVHLDKIDLSLSNIGKTLRKEQTDLRYAEESLVEVKEKVKTFDWVDEAEGCLVKLEQFETSLWEKKKRRTILETVILKIDSCDIDIEEISQLTQYESEVNILIKCEKSIKTNSDRAGRLNGIIGNIELIEKKIEEIEISLDEDRIEFEELMPKQCPLCGRGE
jgi:exonuclease SbcC